MDKVVKYIGSIFHRKERKPYASHINEVLFGDNREGQLYLEYLISEFTKYNTFNTDEINEDLSNNIQIFIHCAANSITSTENSYRLLKRVDGYLYIYYQISEHMKMAKINHNQIDEFRIPLYQQLGSLFKSTNGIEPNLATRNSRIIHSLMIQRDLFKFSEIKTTDDLHSFFAVCKLSFQALPTEYEYHHGRWYDLLSKIHHIDMVIDDVISYYVQYKSVFGPFSLDVSSFILLIQKSRLQKCDCESPFVIYNNIIKNLQLDYRAFYYQYQLLFENDMRNNTYKKKHATELLMMLSEQDDLLFDNYLQIFCSHIDSKYLWWVFLFFCKNSRMNDNTVKHFAMVLTQKFLDESIDVIKSCYETGKRYMKDVDEKVQQNIIAALGAIFQTFVNKNLVNKQYCNDFTESVIEELLDITIDLSAKDDIPHDSCLMVIRHLLFPLDDQITGKVRKIQQLFEKLNYFNKSIILKNNPCTIIKDEWLNDYIFCSIDDLCAIIKDDYTKLYNTHQNNPWSIYVWNRIIYLTTLKFDNTNPNDILQKFNRWIVNIERNIYNIEDTLMNICVGNIFEIIIFKHFKSVIFCPDIQDLFEYIVVATRDNSQSINEQHVQETLECAQEFIRKMLLLNNDCTTYQRLPSGSISYYVILSMDIKTILSSSCPNQYKFLNISKSISSLISVETPNDIDITKIEHKDQYLQSFLIDVNSWIKWFDNFIEIFQYLIGWFKTVKVDQAKQLFIEIYEIQHYSKTTINEMKGKIQKILKFLQPIDSFLPSLCHLLNILQPFDITVNHTLSSLNEHRHYILENQQQHYRNTFIINRQTQVEKHFIINDQRRVYWSIACEREPCDVTITYQTNDTQTRNYQLYSGKNVRIDEQFLFGEFQTQRGGKLIIRIDNQASQFPRIIWYNLKQFNLSSCHLFQRIFNMQYTKYFDSSTTVKDCSSINTLFVETFDFINNLLNGGITLGEMDRLKSVFHNENIDVHQEVTKLFAICSLKSKDISTKEKIISSIVTSNQSNQTHIIQVYEYLKIYQYYSHHSIIIDCVKNRFNLVSNDKDHQQTVQLEDMTIDNNCLLKDISKTVKDMHISFQHLNNYHLELIKTMVQCSNFVNMMKEFNFYSDQGFRRFQDLQNSLTTQFQLQERNNTILNSWIISHTLCKPFILQVKSLTEFVDNLAQLSNIDENSLKHIKIVNDNIQIIRMWLSAEETTILDNALITMEHIYITGIVHIYLNRLINEQSYFEIEYSTEKNSIDNDRRINEKIKFTLSAADINDHKRQLTFVHTDLTSNMSYRKNLLKEQLKLLQSIENVYDILIKLEISGHPNYQLMENRYEIFDRSGEIGRIILHLRYTSDLDENLDKNLKYGIQKRTEYFSQVHADLESTYNSWITDLNRFREKNVLLQLFSNRQIMIMIILLKAETNGSNQIRRKFLQHLLLEKYINRENFDQFQITIICMSQYLQSLRLNNENLSHDRIVKLYNSYNIKYDSPASKSLKHLSGFLNDLFDYRNDIMKTDINESQQFFVQLNPLSQQTSERIRVENNFDMDTCCILLNIFNDQLPSDYQILWCSSSTEDDIRLFFLRVKTFLHLTFAVMDIDKMHHRLRQILFDEQDRLSEEAQTHAPIYYFSRETTFCRKFLKLFYVKSHYHRPEYTYEQVIKLFKMHQIPLPQIHVVYGQAGIGKTHRIKTKYKNDNILSISINDKMNLSSLVSTLLSFQVHKRDDQLSVFLNISIHAPLEQLNRALFSLFICNSLNDHTSGLTFAPSKAKPWKYIVEIPYSEQLKRTVRENFNQILPLVAILSRKNVEEITAVNYQLFINDEEKLVATFLKANSEGEIDRLCKEDKSGKTYPVHFDKLTDEDECRQYIYNCIKTLSSPLPKNKISELSFTKFLYRRVRFFTGFFYCYNMNIPCLGSIVMKQMIEESQNLTQIRFLENCPHTFLVYDPQFALHILYNHRIGVPKELQSLLTLIRPITRNTDNIAFRIECLSWLIDIKPTLFEKVMKEANFILTENFTYKLFHIHERKLTKLPLIIEGETGVGKSFLLKFYSSLLNANIRYGKVDHNLIPRVLERTNSWLLNDIIFYMVKIQRNFLNEFLEQIRCILHEYDDREILDEQQSTIRNEEFLLEIVESLRNSKYNENVLVSIWETLLTISDNYSNDIRETLIRSLSGFITQQVNTKPLIRISDQLESLLKRSIILNKENSIEMLKEFLFHTTIKSLFYRLLLHPGVTEQHIENFMRPIIQLAEKMSDIELVVFFDEVNTSSCLGLFKEMLIDRTLNGNDLPKNIFFTAAINPSCDHNLNSQNDYNKDFQVHRTNYIVHELPESFESLKVPYGILDEDTLKEYISEKLEILTSITRNDDYENTHLRIFQRDTLTSLILISHNFCLKHLGANSVSQREIQRCFNLIQFFQHFKCNINDTKSDLKRCTVLSLALIYYFRLPSEHDNLQRGDTKTPSREEFIKEFSDKISDFAEIIEEELENFVNTDNFVIPKSVAINQAIREHIFSIVVSIATRIPLCIIGAPGQSKTLSFQIVLQNLQGSELSAKQFCKLLPGIDPFYCLGSKYTRSEDIAYAFERAIKREKQYETNRINTRCVVFLDEASLPDENKMILKVLHPYLDECEVAFVAIANKSFDPANANRMMCIYRSLPKENDLEILAYGCLGLEYTKNKFSDTSCDNIITGLCKGYCEILKNDNIRKVFHDRDFIYMLRELHFELPTTTRILDGEAIAIKASSILRALENNFNGMKQEEFNELRKIFFNKIEKYFDYSYSTNDMKTSEETDRDILAILRESMGLDSKRRRLYGRYKLIIDESDDENAIDLLLQAGIVDSNPDRTTIFRLSDFSNDVNDEICNVEILSTIKLCMETGKTIVMINTNRIHGALYDVFNQNFSIMATGEQRKIFSKVAIGPKTMDVTIHEDFQCIVHVKRSDFKDIPAAFLSRFQKYSISIRDFYHIQLHKLKSDEQNILKDVEQKAESFIEHFGRQYFHGLNEYTLCSCLFSLIIKNNNEYNLLNINQHYREFTSHLKTFIGANLADDRLCLLLWVISKLIQIASPESIILKLSTFKETFRQWLYSVYFQEQEHFSIEIFIKNFLLGSPDRQTSDIKNILNNRIDRTTKTVIFTRTSTSLIGLSQETKRDLFNSSHDVDFRQNYRNIGILNLNTIESSRQLQKQLDKYKKDNKANILIIIIDGRSKQRLHIPFIRHLIDKIECLNERKHFLLIIHSPSHDLHHQSCFSSVFLYNWDYYFFDTCKPNNSFHLQKMLNILLPSHDEETSQDNDNILCNLDTLFNECLWYFCSRITINHFQLPENEFTHKTLYKFYHGRTNALDRVKCLRQILRELNDLKKYIIDIYHESLRGIDNSSKKIYNFIYQISKGILCDKRFDGLIDSVQLNTQNSFTNFVSNILVYLANDYGLDALTQFAVKNKNYTVLLNLIDYKALSVNDDNDEYFSIITTQRIFQLTFHYGYIMETPLFYLFHQRIKRLADDVKVKKILMETKISRGTDRHNLDHQNKNTINQYTFEDFRYNLMVSILQDKTLTNIICKCESILESFTNDLIRTCCTGVENHLNNVSTKYLPTIEFISRCLRFTDVDDLQSLECSENKKVWRIAHVYASLEYRHYDVISMYTACRIMNVLHPENLSKINLFDDINMRWPQLINVLFDFMFNELWDTLQNLCINNKNLEIWIYAYTIISKYYPSEKVLACVRLKKMEKKIELMNLFYFILLNSKLLVPQNLIKQLAEKIALNGKLSIIESFTQIFDIIYEHLRINSTLYQSKLFIDLQQWMLKIIKSKISQLSVDDICQFLSFLNSPTCLFSFDLKQIYFDELVELIIKKRFPEKNKMDLWDRFCLISDLLKCMPNTDVIENYKIPCHPMMLSNNNPCETVLFDLYFFYLTRRFADETITWSLVNKGMFLRKLTIPNKTCIEKLFQQLRDYFRIQMTSLLLCETTDNNNQLNEVHSLLSTIICERLSCDENPTQLDDYLQLFLSTIISKKSWNYLLNLLTTENIQRVNQEWATKLYDLLRIKSVESQNNNLQMYHKIQFTMSEIDQSSIFPEFHRYYAQLQCIISTCIQNNTANNQWESFYDWIESQTLELNKIKVLLLLNIYYEYYCNDKLSSISNLLNFVENKLQLSDEETRIFRAFMLPQTFMIGYPNDDNRMNDNFINTIFRLDCQNEFELTIRHMLVNLLAMILLGGENSFLWTHVFQPTTLQHTYGFASTTHTTIEEDNVHYDCGCVLSQNGELHQFGNRNTRSSLNIPAIYVAYFSTFGALAWHLLLFDESDENLCGPILSPGAINENARIHRHRGHTTRSKVCDFVCTRLLSTYHFLSTRSNQYDSCIILTRCFERMAFLTLNQQSWIKTHYRTDDEQIGAEHEYNINVFYFVYDNLNVYKTYINQLHQRSQIQKKLQAFVDEMPINIQFINLKTEAYRAHDHVFSFKILQRFLQSFEILKLTRLVYDLTEFYLLLHHTYALLIEQDEFFTITLEELYNRGKNRFYSYDIQYSTDKKNHTMIIHNGIDAVNAYREFSNGFIQPGACRQTQKFTEIGMETPVSYLVTNEDHEDGDIIMRIISILVDEHNYLLDLLDEEVYNNKNIFDKSLKMLIDQVTSRTVSIIQVAYHNTGVIHLTENDCYRIEQLSRASLINNENQRMFTSNSKVTFDLEYFQTWIIRTYFLCYRIDYNHVRQKYQCQPKRVQKQLELDLDDLSLDEKYSVPLSNKQIEIELTHIKDKVLDTLYTEYVLLKQIASLLNNSDIEKPSMSLYEFVQTLNHNQCDNELYDRLKQCKIQDFKICHINHILQLYLQHINGTKHLFVDISPLLRIPIDEYLSHELMKSIDKHLIDIDYNDDCAKIQLEIQRINKLFDDWKDMESLFLQQYSCSLKDTCRDSKVENTIIDWIPEKIQCQNYAVVKEYLIHAKSKLQEKRINIEEQKKTMWNHDFNSSVNEDEMYLQRYFNSKVDKETINDQNLQHMSNEWKILPINSTLDPSNVSDEDNQMLLHELDKNIVSLSIIQFHIKIISYSSSSLIEQIQKYRDEMSTEQTTKSNVLRVTIISTDKIAKKYLWKREKFTKKLDEYFSENNYNRNTHGIVDNDEVFVNFNNNYNLGAESEVEFRIIDQQDFIETQLQFKETIYEYKTTSLCRISTILKRFIDDNQLRSSDRILYFFNQFGKCIDDRTVAELCTGEKMISISVIEQLIESHILCQIEFLYKNKSFLYLFNSTIKWAIVNQWVQMFLSENENSTTKNYVFFDENNENIVDENAEILSLLESQNGSATVYVMDQKNFVNVIMSYEDQCISTFMLTSKVVSSLLTNRTVLQNINLTHVDLNNYFIVLKGENERCLTNTDLKQPLRFYVNDKNQILHFQISIRIKIIKYGEGEEMELYLESKKSTIEQLLNLTKQPIEVYKYLVAENTKKILNRNVSLSELDFVNFFLVKENETCYVKLKQSNSNCTDENNLYEKSQHFVNFGTIADVARANQIDISQQYLLYSNEFILSSDIQLKLLQSESPIEFSVINKKLPCIVTIEYIEETQSSTSLHCSKSVSIRSLCKLACQLYNLNQNYYKLSTDNFILDDEDIILEDIDSELTEFQCQLKCVTSLFYSVTYNNRTIKLPCQKSTTMKFILEEAMQKFSTPSNNSDSYQLKVLIDDSPDVDDELSISDIQESLFSDTSIIPFELDVK